MGINTDIGRRWFTRKTHRARPVFHIWNGHDTACRMASTGGLNLEKYVEYNGEIPANGVICAMCRAVTGTPYRPSKAADFAATRKFRKAG